MAGFGTNDVEPSDFATRKLTSLRFGFSVKFLWCSCVMHVTYLAGPAGTELIILTYATGWVLPGLTSSPQIMLLQ
jgi:hypothetical protein